MKREEQSENKSVKNVVIKKVKSAAKVFQV